MTAKHGDDGEWEYPTVEKVMNYAGIHPIGVYIKKRQTTIAERFAGQPVYAFCTEAEMMTGTSRMVRWWYKNAVNDLKV